MRTFVHSSLLALTMALPIALSSCSKNELAQPNAPVASSTAQADVKVENGRLVFADLDAFTKVTSNLGKMNFKELAQWEQDLKFTSLRAVAATQSEHFEQLQNSGQTTIAFDLMQSFGIPTFYAAAISPDGEYQIGNKLFWFHKGYKYEAGSEQELAQIKQNPSVAKEKSRAGILVVTKTAAPTKAGSPEKAGNPLLTTNAVQSNQLDSDDKYVSPTFYYDNDSGSWRRIIFGTHIYSEYMGTNSGVATWHSVFYLRSKVDYYSFGRKSWYPADGSNRTTYYNVSFTGSAARLDYESYATNVNVNQSLQYPYALSSDRNQDFSLADVQVQAPRVFDGNDERSRTDPAYIYWNFQMSGSIQSTVGTAGKRYNYTYVAGGPGGGPLWQ